MIKKMFLKGVSLTYIPCQSYPRIKRVALIQAITIQSNQPKIDKI